MPRLAARVLDLDGHELGLLGEELAARALVRRGWRVLGRRVAVGRLELDLLMHDGSARVAVEVKTGRRGALPRPAAPAGGEPGRPPGLRSPGERLGAAQAARLARAARRVGAARVDLVEVELARGHATIRHARGGARRDRDG